MAKALPKKLYGYWRDEGSSDVFFLTSSNFEGLLLDHETKTVGIYERKGTAKVANKTLLADK